MRSLIPASLVAVSLAILVAACGGSTGTDSPTPTPPTTPTPVLVTDNYAGDLATGGSDVRNFSVGIGTVTVTLTGITPLATASIGMSVGTWDAAATTCTAILKSDNMKVGDTLVGTAVAAVALCVKTYDVGNIPADSTYSFTFSVAHY